MAKRPLTKEEVKKRKEDGDKHNKAIVDALFGVREGKVLKSKEELVHIARINRERFVLNSCS